MAKQFLMLHGWGGSDPTHWQDWLKNELVERGEKVCFPQLPKAMNPVLNEWMEALKNEISHFDPDDEVIVLAFSLGCTLWIHFVHAHKKFATKKVYLVCPTPDDCGIPEIENFFPIPLGVTPSTLLNTLVVYSDNDPYIPYRNYTKFLDEYGFSSFFITRAGHINIGSGYGPWPWMLERCLS